MIIRSYKGGISVSLFFAISISRFNGTQNVHYDEIVLQLPQNGPLKAYQKQLDIKSVLECSVDTGNLIQMGDC